MARKPKLDVLRIRCTPVFKQGVEKIAEKEDSSASAITREALYQKFPELKNPEPVAQPQAAEVGA
jgi:predicted transcriptional regulator